MILMLSALAFGRDAIGWSIVSAAQVGQGTPVFTIETHESGAVDVVVTCAGKSFGMGESFGPGQRLNLALPGLPAGRSDCRALIQLRAANGESGEASTHFAVEMLPVLHASASPADFSRADGRLNVHTNRAIADGTCEIIGDYNRPLWTGPMSVSATEAACAWDPSLGDPLRITARVRDQHGFAFELSVLPWWYAIPHDDLVFASNSAEITAEEAPKLERAWREVEQVEARFAGVAPVRLYVAGYTDTVGDSGNNHVLSDRRARAIGAWFQDRGFRGSVHYQGFGEAALAVPTGDGVDEPRNRRATYIISAEAPPISEDLPNASWRPL